jgi:LacI family transcriptional regulator
MKSCSETRPTIKDVARLANVSHATVSRALSNPVGLAASTLDRVKHAVKELGYSPNQIARSLKVQKSHAVGIVVPDILNPFFAHVARGAERILSERGYSTTLCDSEETPEKEGRYIVDLFQRRVDGLIFIPTVERGEVKKLIKKNSTPTVFVDRFLGEEFDCIKINNLSGMSLLVSHLVNRGYKDIGLVSGPLETLPGRERFEAFNSVLARFNLAPKPGHVRISDFTIEGGYRETVSLIRSSGGPEAIIASNNLMGIGAIKAIRDSGINIPDDIGLVVFDEILLGDLIQPPLTVVTHPAVEMGKEAARILLDRMAGKGPSSPRLVVYEPKLEIRKSTR